MDFKCDFRMVDFGSLKALLSVTIGDFEIRGFKVIDQGDGKPWVSAPSREIIKGGNKEYYEIVRFTNEDARKEFNRKVIEEYRKLAPEQTEPKEIKKAKKLKKAIKKGLEE